MRRTSVFLALAAILITAIVGVTYYVQISKHIPTPRPRPEIGEKLEGRASEGWHYQKDDPVSNLPIVRVDAESFEGTHDPSTFSLTKLSLKLFNKKASNYTLVKANNADFDEGTGRMISQGPVSVVMNVPAEVAASDTKQLDKRVHIETTGVVYETKTGRAFTDKPTKFVFPQGGGDAVGADYDPNQRILHLHSAVSLDWVGTGPAANKLHVETSDLIYKELEHKIYMSPWSKMQRQTLNIQGQNSIVTLDEDGHLRQVDAVGAVGTDDRNGRKVEYTAANMTAIFNEDGALQEVVGDKDARVTSLQSGAKTTITGDHADLSFAISTETVDDKVSSDSELHAVSADGHAVAISEPLAVPGVLQGDTRILKSEHILLTMKPGGQEVEQILSPVKANLEFKPNRPGLPHRILDAAKLKVTYGDNSYVESFTASDVKTRTDKPPGLTKSSDGKPPAPTYTWSDELFAKFKPGSNDLQSIDQKGHFRYQEGDRKADAGSAQVIQDTNRITLKDKARVLDDTGSTYADLILMDQQSGDMDATGHVRSTRLPDKKQKPGTSMLDATQTMQAQADKMVSRDSNTKVSYVGHSVLWQGANRISADIIDIDRDDESLHATGQVVSELVDNKNNTSEATTKTDAKTKTDSKPVDAPIFTIVRAPDLVYHDDTRIALYTGGVTLVRQKMTVTSDQMRAILTPKTDQTSNDSSLDHAFADGRVKVFSVVADNRTRTGTSEHGEYFTKEDKVILNGGAPQFVDSQKGLFRGNQFTYFEGEDRLIVDGDEKKPAFTKMKKR